ncbi:hypothetical protein [Catellatospora vulcania]|uniref:hypothetical protein n=1 Tax=Catellatospora vulcania TaxID=1460450 RepID=UPI0012D4A4BE|nr:hypothetical protein [Catellatospora vulcania]
MRPPPADWYVDVLGTGCIAGVHPDDDPDEVTARLVEHLGEYAENRNGDSLWYDFGLVEAHWQRSSRFAPWQGLFFMVQTHRLDLPPHSTPPSFAEIERRAGVLGIEFVDVPRSYDDGYRDVSAVGTGVSLLVMREPQEYTLSVPIGAIAKISVPEQTSYRDPLGAMPSGRWDSLRQSMKALLAMDESQRRRWLESHADGDAARSPDGKAGGDVVWWRERLRVAGSLVTIRPGPGPASPETLALVLWLFDRAAERVVFAPAVAAHMRASLLVELADRDPTVGAGSAAATDAARRCLSALPLTAAEARALPPSWRDRTPAERDAARLTRALTRLAWRLSPTDGDLAAEAASWDGLRRVLSGAP